MKSLAERHEARAERIVSNASEVNGNVGNLAGAAISLFTDAMTAVAALSAEDRATFEDSVKDVDFEAIVGPSLAESQDGTRRTMAGIGVVNTKVVPAGLEVPEAGNGGGTKADGWGANAAPAATVPTDDNGNNAGRSLQEQGAGSDLKASAKQAAADIKDGSVPGATTTEPAGTGTGARTAPAKKD